MFYKLSHDEDDNPVLETDKGKTYSLEGCEGWNHNIGFFIEEFGCLSEAVDSKKLAELKSTISLSDSDVEECQLKAEHYFNQKQRKWQNAVDWNEAVESHAAIKETRKGWTGSGYSHDGMRGPSKGSTYTYTVWVHPVLGESKEPFEKVEVPPQPSLENEMKKAMESAKHRKALAHLIALAWVKAHKESLVGLVPSSVLSSF